jgi:hypothetical protein
VGVYFNSSWGSFLNTYGRIIRVKSKDSKGTSSGKSYTKTSAKSKLMKHLSNFPASSDADENLPVAKSPAKESAPPEKTCDSGAAGGAMTRKGKGAA